MDDVEKSFKSLTGIAFKDAARHPLAAGSAISMGTLSAKAQNAGAKRVTTSAGKKLKMIPQITKPAKQASAGTGRGTSLAMQAMESDAPGKVMRQLTDPTSGTRRAGQLASAYASSRGWIGKSMTKEDKSDLKSGAAALTGAAGAQGAYLMGYGGKFYTKAQRNKHPLTDKQKKILSAHRKATKNPEFFRTYPRGLPAWKVQRALGWTHGGKTGVALSGAMMATGGALGYKAYQKKERVRKADDISYLKSVIERIEQQLRANPSAKKRASLTAQHTALQKKLALAEKGEYSHRAANAANMQAPRPKVIRVKPSVFNQIKHSKAIRGRGFMIPTAIAVGAGAAGYGVHRNNRTQQFKPWWGKN